MIEVKELIWDDWNRDHITEHGILPEEVEEVCQDKYRVIDSYRKRILVIGKTNDGMKLAVVLSPEDRNLQVYGDGIYYVITAFKKEVKL